MIELFITDAALRRSVYRVFRLPAAHAEKANVLLGDDLVSRQSVTVREARSLGLKGDDRFIVVEHWASRDALDAHLSSSHMADYASKVGAFRQQPADVQVISAERVA